MRMNLRLIFTYLTLYVIILYLFGCTNNKVESTTYSTDDIESRYRISGANEILSVIRQKADIVTTEVKLRKIAIYDSNQSEHFELTDPTSWKYGERKCIIPVEITIKYGYDLRDIGIDDIKISNDSTAVMLTLPKPKIIDSGYNSEIEEGSATCISTGARDIVGHQLQEEIRKKAYEEVMNEDFSKIFIGRIENNAKILLENIIKSLGWKTVEIIEYDKQQK